MLKQYMGALRGFFIIFIFILQFNNVAVAEQNNGSQVSCAKLSDDFCEALWSPKNNGNIEGEGFKLFKGRSTKSDMLHVERLDYLSYINHEAEFPADFRERIAPTLKEMRQHLEKENQSRSWLRKLRDLADQINYFIRETADERTFAKHPELRLKRSDDFIQPEWTWLATDFFDLKNELLRIRYEKDENWLRIERIFAEVKKDFLDSIDIFPPFVRDAVRKKIETVKLSLPYADPRLTSNDTDCASTEDNAYYYPSANTFQVCVGRFNTSQDDASHYVTIAHELSHAVDPGNFSEDEFFLTLLGNKLQQFCTPKPTQMTCSDWQSLKAEILTPTDMTPRISPYDHLTSCFRSKSTLEEFNANRVKQIARRQNRQRVSGLADANSFTILAQPTVRKNGKKVPNEYFFRPDYLLMKFNDNVAFQGKCGFNFMAPLFTQILACAGKRQGDTHSSVKPADLKAALQDLTNLRSAIDEKWLAFCGRECWELQDEAMSRDSTEDFADWMSFKLLAKRLAREDRVATRRSWAARAKAQFCERPGPLKDAPELMKVEKTFSLAPHGENRVRRLSVFQPEIAKLAECRLTDEIASSGTQCSMQ